MADRSADTERFYSLLDLLSARTGGHRLLRDCQRRMGWPERGVYFFFEPGETRSGSGSRGRIVRVGTHGLKAGSKSTLWGRLSQHRGSPMSGVGNHRGSIFRLLIGIALAQRTGIPLPSSWGVGRSRGEAARRLGLNAPGINDAEASLEMLVSRYIGEMPFLWLEVSDSPGPDSSRGFIERNAIALLSGYNSPQVDGPSPDWLGWDSDRERVRSSGLWNNNHVDQTWDPGFLDEMESWTEAMAS